VFGAGATATATVDVIGRHYTLRAALTPAKPLAPSPGRSSAVYAGTLDLALDDGAGHAWHHAYTASGPIELEGDQVVAPTGLVLPGASSPSTAYDQRHAQLPGAGAVSVVDVYVDVGISAEPKR
jgi:hypothetical protein